MINEAIIKEFGSRIRQLRSTKNLSQERLSFVTGFHRTYIGKFKIGDTLSDLRKALPGEFEFKDCKGNTGAILGDFQYIVEVNCCKIVRIEYGPRQEWGYTVGEIKPCLKD